jgi:hypothetical protein
MARRATPAHERRSSLEQRSVILSEAKNLRSFFSSLTFNGAGNFSPGRGAGG